MTDPAPTRPARVPPFFPVPVRARADGWTPLKQAEFIGVLAETGSVSKAAAFVDMARETAYRLRTRPGAESFAAAWDAALLVAGLSPRRILAQRVRGKRGRMEQAGPAKVTPSSPWRAIVSGRWRVVLRGGKYCGSVREAHNSGVLRWLAQVDRAMMEERRALRRRLRSQVTKSGGSVPGQAPGPVSGQVPG